MREAFKEVTFKGRELINRATAVVALACMLAIACSCSSHAGDINGREDRGLHAQEATPTGATTVPAGVAVGGMGLDLVNFTGSALRAVYISPSSARTS